jgi:elongation factor P
MLAKEIKNGTVVVYEGNPVLIGGVTVQTPSARGAATLYKFRGKNVVTGQKVDLTLKGTDSLDEADFAKRAVQLMYSDGSHLHLMDLESYHHYELPVEDAQEQIPYLTEGLEGLRALVYNEACVGLEVPAAVELTIKECDPGIKGNSATSRTKPATLETDLVVQVPEYIKPGERIKVDTRTGEYLSRV